MLKSQIKRGGKDVLLTTTFISDEGEVVDISPFVDGFDGYVLSFVFVHDDEREIPFYEHFPEGNKRVVRVTSNSASSHSNTEPMHVANWQGRKIFMDMSCSSFGTNPVLKRATSITLFDGGKVDE